MMNGSDAFQSALIAQATARSFSGSAEAIEPTCLLHLAATTTFVQVTVVTPLPSI